MDTLEELGKRINTTQDLRAIVRTMKTLSAVNIRQYDTAVLALREYAATIEMGLRIVLGGRRGPLAPENVPGNTTYAIVFGSDHGLCGRFNFDIVRHAREEVSRLAAPDEHVVYLVAGARAAAHLEALGETVSGSFLLPGSVNGLTAMAQDMLLDMEQRQSDRGLPRVLLFYNRHSEGTTAAPFGIQHLPLDGRWLAQIAGRPWPSRCLPTFTMDRDRLFTALARQYLFIGLFRAGAESAASEHATRLAAMQTAEHNIRDSLGELTAAYSNQRQASITAELLDIVAGFEVLEGEDARGE